MSGIPYPTTTNTIEAVNYETGTSQNDRITTNNISNTFLNSGDGDDYITLTSWNVTTNAGAGDDVIEIFSRSNVTGGSGADYFVFDGNEFSGNSWDWSASVTWSTIKDYSDGEDKIAILNDTAGVTDFSDLTFATEGSHVRIGFPTAADAPTILVENAIISNFDASDFIFGDGTTGGGSNGGGSGGTTITVSSVSELRSALADPSYDTILVEAGTYVVTDGDPAYTNGAIGEAGIYVGRDVTIQSSGTGRADFYSGTDVGKALFLTGPGASVTFDGIGFLDTRVIHSSHSGTANYAGLLSEGNEGDTITVLNGYFENNYNAIRSKSYSGDLFIDNTTFFDNGSNNGSGQEHQIYWDGTSLHIEDSSFDESGSGHSIKTVTSESTTILRTDIVDGPNGASLINATGGGDLTIVDSNLTKDSQQTNSSMIDYWAVRGNASTGSITIQGNTITSSYQHPINGEFAIILNNYTDSSATFSGNDLVGDFTSNPILGLVDYQSNLLTGSFYGFDPTVSNPNPSWRAAAIELSAGQDELDLGSSGQSYSAYNFFSATAGLDGNDIITADADSAKTNVIFGDLGDDGLYGGGGNDWLYGESGNDVILVGSAVNRDQAFGGEGNDYLGVGALGNGASAKVWLDGGVGDDILDGRTASNFRLIGGEGSDILLGSLLSNSSWNSINGGTGDDIVYGGKGYTQYLFGGAGIDTLVYQGDYGVDFSVSHPYGGSARITGATSLGLDEVSSYGESGDGFEYIQFGNGVYDTTSQTFVADEVRVDIAALLSTAIPPFPSSGSGGGSGSGVPYPTTTNTIEAVNYETGTSQNDRITTNNISNTFLNSGDGDDYITLTSWNVTTNAGAGDDVIEIFSRSNVTGGSGADYFVFDGNEFSGNSWDWSASVTWSTIKDYSDGEDKIAILNDTAGVTDFSDLTFATEGSHVRIGFPTAADAPTILVENAIISNFDASDFIFGDGTTGGGSNGGGSGGGSGSGVPYPTTTNTIEAVNYETGTAQNDRITTNNISNTFLNSGDGNDYITLTSWNVTTNAGAGDDVIEIFNRGSVTGGSGADYFVFDGNEFSGNSWDWSASVTWSTIKDYSDGEDKIAILNGTAGVTDFFDLTFTTEGNHVRIGFPSAADAPTILVENTTVSDFGADDFIFL